ncbi:MAG: NADH:flavin oxidoreductase [Thermodesulfobacteriota bacterium]|nr:NADH:flavin oxidoreductase [Thermodesulfobacteriota bacterium]
MKLFEPLRVKDTEFKNRIVFPPIVTNFGLRNDQARAYYQERAIGGAGLIIIHATPVDAFLKESWVSGLIPLIDSVHAEGAKVMIQLWHGNQYDKREIAPSPTSCLEEATKDEINQIQEKFAIATERSKNVGFDGIEIHGAHGYLVNQFFSPLTNQRGDEYGGTLENRMRFALECIKTIRSRVGNSYLILFRHSAVDLVDGGTTIEESCEFAKALKEAGVDILDVSAGSAHSLSILNIPATEVPEATYADLAHKIRLQAHMPVIAVGKIFRPTVAENLLTLGKTDLVAIGRQLLADPYWPQKVREKRHKDIVECIYCNTCTENMRAGGPITCTVNDRLGVESESERS